MRCAATSQPLKVAPRAPKEFLGGMPPAFFDALVPVAAKGTQTAPKLERATTFAEIAPWLADQPELRQAMHRRFHPPKPTQRHARNRLNLRMKSWRSEIQDQNFVGSTTKTRYPALGNARVRTCGDFCK
jgi:hypothetical protein